MKTPSSRLPLFLICVVFVLVITPIPVSADPPPNFAADPPLIVNLNFPTSMAFLPDGRMLIGTLLGTIHIVQAGATTVDPTPYLVVPNVIADAGERGLWNVVVDPNYASNGYIYAYYACGNCGNMQRAQLSRFTVRANNPNQANPASQTTIWQDNEALTLFHNGGGIAFGNDGKIFLSIGDGGWEGPNGSQDLSRFRGKILRLNPDGTIPPDNPFNDGPDPNQEAVWAYGLRNPFRIFFDSPTGRLFIADVGADTMEEINVVTAPGANFGWPICEGSMCSPGGPPPDYVPPLYSYPHNGMNASVTGGFVYRGQQFPGLYQGSYFYGDYSQLWIRRLAFDASGNFTGNQFFQPFDGSTMGPYGGPVDLDQGPEGALYYVDLGWAPGTGNIRRIKYTGSNQPPQFTSVNASPTSGLVPPLMVTFTSAATDGDNDPLTYSWDFGDGSQASGANVTYTYIQPGNFVARASVSDGADTTLSDPITITIGSAPDATIVSPADGQTFRAGDVINFVGTATDEGPLTASSYIWTIQMLHLDHVHPAGQVIGPSGTFTIPTSGHELDDTTRFRFLLTVTDETGLSDTEVVVIEPDTAPVTINSQPPGIVVSVDGIPRVAPITMNPVIGFQHTLSAATQQTVGGDTYIFLSWSDGGAPTHVITVPPTGQTLTVNYQNISLPTNTPSGPTATPTAINTLPPLPPAFTYQPSPTASTTPITATATPTLPPTATPVSSPTPSPIPTATFTPYLLPTATATLTQPPPPPP